MPKKDKQKSREYLEAALDQVKKLLPGWVYATIHRAAFPSAGGRAARNRRLSAMEKVWVEKSLKACSNQDLKSMWHKLSVTRASYKRQNKDIKAVVSRAKAVAAEMNRRGLAHPGKLSTEIEKGFVTGYPEGGMHAHGLDRRNDKTVKDGYHLHLFIIPGTNERLLTQEDGAHEHDLENINKKSGVHSHRVYLPDGRDLETKLGGPHNHNLMVETTGFDGIHTHQLKLPDGSIVQSINPDEYVDRFLDIDTLGNCPVAPASIITSSINELRDLREQIWEEPTYPTIDEAVEALAKSNIAPTLPLTTWEVTKVDNEINCSLANMEDTIIGTNPNDLVLDIGDIVDISVDGAIQGFSKSAEPMTFEEVESINTYCNEVLLATRTVDFKGEKDAKFIFVGSSPSELELIRKEAIIGPDGTVFQDKYLTPFKLTRKDIAVGFAIPVYCPDIEDKDIALWKDNLLKSIVKFPNARVVALGRVAKKALGDIAEITLPHPAAVRRHGDSGEVSRKLKKLAKILDITYSIPNNEYSPPSVPSVTGIQRTNLTESISDSRDEETFRVAVTKSAPDKQIVYGVVLDPYQVDLQNDWIPPSEIESAAHDFLEKSRVIGLRHKGVAKAKLVESWVEIYPSKEERELALANLPHKAFRRSFGNDVIHSGAWVAGVKLSNDLWKEYQKGELNAFSIGGFSFKTQVSTDAMPQVEFIDLQPSA